jgi:hypothetical protein
MGILNQVLEVDNLNGSKKTLESLHSMPVAAISEISKLPVWVVELSLKRGTNPLIVPSQRWLRHDPVFRDCPCDYFPFRLL